MTGPPTPRRSPRLPDALACLGLLAAAALLLAPLFDGDSWPPTHDNTFRYFWLVDHFHAALRAGSLYPRWLPDAFAGYGSPIFLFYQPGFFYVASAVRELVAEPLASMGLTLWIYLALGGLGAFGLARRGGATWPAFLCALLFLLTPYLSVNLHVRGDVTEFAGMLLAPWPLLLCLWLADQDGTRPVRWWGTLLLCSLALAAMPLTHPAVALFYFPCCALLAMTAAARSPRPARARIGVGLAFVWALCLSAPYWGTFLAMRQYVMFDDLHEGYFTASHHLVWPGQLVSTFWGFDSSIQGPDDGMSFQLGAVHALWAVGGFVVARGSRLLQLGAGLYLLLIVAMTPAAAPLWDALPFLSNVQFPWRILSVTAVLQLVLGGGWLRLGSAKSGAVLALGVLLTLVWGGERLGPNPRRIEDARQRIAAHPDSYLEVFHAYSEPTSDAVLARTARDLRDAGPRGTRPYLELRGERAATEANDHTKYRLHYEIAAGPATSATLNQVYLPGWDVRLDGRRLTRAELEASLDRFGRLELELSPEAHSLRAHYGGPPHGGTRAAVALALGLASCALAAWWLRRQRNRRATA